MQETGQYGYIPATFAALETMFARYGFEVFDYSYLPETNDSQYAVSYTHLDVYKRQGAFPRPFSIGVEVYVPNHRFPSYLRL